MEINIQELLEGKGTIIKNREYYPTKNYVEPFINKVTRITDEFNIQVKMPDQMTTASNNLDKTYNRVLIQAVLPESYSFDGISQVIGMSYALDVRKPVVKFYRSGLDKDTNILYLLNSNWLQIQEIEAESPFDFNPVKNLLEITDDLKVDIDKLKTDTFDRNPDIIAAKLGKWIHRSILFSYDNGVTQKVKIATSDVISSYKDLFIKSESDHFIETGNTVSTFDVYSAMADTVTNDKGKDIVNKIEKILLLKDILGIQ